MGSRCEHRSRARGWSSDGSRIFGFDNEKFVARVTLRIDRSYQFPKDTSASILTSGLLGEQYIGLDGGGDTQTLKDGEQIKLTQSAVVLEKLIGQFLYGKAAEGGAK